MPTVWNKRARIDPDVNYDGPFAYDSGPAYDAAREGTEWCKRRPINVPLRQENGEYILDDYGYSLMVEMTEWCKRDRIDQMAGYDSAFAYDEPMPYDSAYHGTVWNPRTPI